jgi:hypothetical protein
MHAGRSNCPENRGVSPIEIAHVLAALANILGEKNLVKSLLISTLDKVIYYNGTFLQGSTKPLFSSQNRVETS